MKDGELMIRLESHVHLVRELANLCHLFNSDVFLSSLAKITPYKQYVICLSCHSINT